eukprot:TRINITY_DN9308_c0_g1_i1.p2 TRINITY_DN9308_c0_g1~~TRINITY_DN9308_c0_g1_i1.p2  ORF type:complete len:265 (+),score=63.10 TRINITY_DN9308_c0_g1_i1:334-1128(+)
MELKRSGALEVRPGGVTVVTAPQTPNDVRVAIGVDVHIGDLMFGALTAAGVFCSLRGRLASPNFRPRHPFRRSAFRDALAASGVWADPWADRHAAPTGILEPLLNDPSNATPTGPPIEAVAAPPLPEAAATVPIKKAPAAPTGVQWVAACGDNPSGRWYVGRLWDGRVTPATLSGFQRHRRFVPRDMLLLHPLAPEADVVESESDESEDAGDEESDAEEEAAAIPMDDAVTTETHENAEHAGGTIDEDTQAPTPKKPRVDQSED